MRHDVSVDISIFDLNPLVQGTESTATGADGCQRLIYVRTVTALTFDERISTSQRPTDRLPYFRLNTTP